MNTTMTEWADPAEKHVIVDTTEDKVSIEYSQECLNYHSLVTIECQKSDVAAIFGITWL